MTTGIMTTRKITDELLKQYDTLVNVVGLTQREACEHMGVARSTVQDEIKRRRKLVTEGCDTWVFPPRENASGCDVERLNGLPRILVFDLETSHAVSATFGRHKVFLGQDNIITEGGLIMCCGYRWVGEESPHIIRMTDEEAIFEDDSRVVAEIWELFEQADVVVAHNAKQFDVPMLRARVIGNNLPPLPTVKVIDTLIMAKKLFRFPNNKLDSLAAYFGFERKVYAGGINTWINFMRGDNDAIAHMVEYCLHDVNLCHDIYMKLRPFGHAGSDFNAGLYGDADSLTCPVCGSKNVDETGRSVYTAVSEFKEIRCGDCGGVSRTRQSLNSREERVNILVSPKSLG